MIQVFSSHVTLKTNNLLDPVSYSYGSIFGYWHFQHIYTRSTKDKNNPKKKTFTYSAEWRCFFPVSSWPQDIQQLVWKKPIGYTDMFKLILFFLDNGYSQHLIAEWIPTLQHWTTLQRGVKRARQIDCINNNLDSEANSWFYYDIHHASWLFFNAEFRNTNNL